MDVTKILILTIISIVSLIISIIVKQVLHRKEKVQSEDGGKIPISYGISFLTWIVAFSLLQLKTLSILNEYIDNIYKTNSSNSLEDITKTSILFIGLINVWLIIWYFITRIVSILFMGKRINKNEIDNNNYVYFLMRGAIFISFIYCQIPLFDNILRIFLPNIEIPYYR